MKPKTKNLLPLILLVLGMCASASQIPAPKKRGLRQEIRKLERLLANRYPELEPKTVLDAWYAVYWRTPLDAKKVALAAFLYDIVVTSKQCAECLESAGKTDIEFQRYHEEYHKNKEWLVKHQADLPPAVLTRLAKLDEGLWNDAREATFNLSRYPR